MSDCAKTQAICANCVNYDEGACVHPDHPGPVEPTDTCRDFRCDGCDCSAE